MKEKERYINSDGERSEPLPGAFPATRYQGSKRKLVDWIFSCIADLDYDRVLDAFSGTTAVAYRFKQLRKQVTANDGLKFNRQVARALIENGTGTVSAKKVSRMLALAEKNGGPPGVIEQNFGGIYYLDQENAWLDRIISQIAREKDETMRALLWSALGQSCLIKRPFNLFHRANLSMRKKNVSRSFGNKKTWDRPFTETFPRFVEEFNRAVFDNGQENKVCGADPRELAGEFDLVYLDPPYTSKRGVSVDYRDFYHFLEGMLDYRRWSDEIDYNSKHLRLMRHPNPWSDKNQITACFEQVFERYRDSIIVVSYRGDGIPAIAELQKMLGRLKRKVVVYEARDYRYALSTRVAGEFLLVGQ
jgi:adenine-specific DNA-methyltransferase